MIPVLTTTGKAIISKEGEKIEDKIKQWLDASIEIQELNDKAN